MLSKIGALEAAVASAEAKRREIHNQLVELKGNVRRSWGSWGSGSSGHCCRQRGGHGRCCEAGRAWGTWPILQNWAACSQEAWAICRSCEPQPTLLLPQIRVFCRLRPSQRSAVQCLADGLSVRLAGPDGKEHTFAYDKVFKPESSQVRGRVWGVEGWHSCSAGGDLGDAPADCLDVHIIPVVHASLALHLPSHLLCLASGPPSPSPTVLTALRRHLCLRR